MPTILHPRFIPRALILAGLFSTPLAGATDPTSTLDLGFEAADGGWKLQGAEADGSVMHGGARSMRLRSEEGKAWSVVQRTLPHEGVLGKWVRLSGWIRTSGLQDGAAQLWLRAERAGNTVAFANLEDQALSGDHDWTQGSVAIEVPANADRVVFGGLLQGTGTAWIDDLAFTFGEAAAPPDAEISGTATWSGGGPAPRALIAFVAAGQSAPAAVVTASDEGKFTARLPAGAYALTATHPQGTATYSEPVKSSGKSVRDLRLMGLTHGFPLTGDVRDTLGAPLANAEVHCLRSLSHGDVFVVHADGAGHYSVRLPPEDYACRAVAGELRSPLVSVAKGTERKDLLIHRPAPAPQPVIDWIRGQSIPLKTAAAGQGFADLAPLREVVGTTRVVGLGEATHGSREIFQMKHRIFEYLVAELGFTVFAFEANWPESEAVEEYVRTGQGDPAKALAGMYFWTWNTEEVLDLIRWMRQWNAVPGHRQVHFYGIDVQIASVAAKRLAERLGQIDPALAAEAGPALTKIAEGGRGEPPAEDTLAALTKLLPKIAERLPAPASATDRQALVDRQSTRVLSQFLDLHSAPEGYFLVRDRAMAENLRWVADVAEPGSRIVLWAHNGHLVNTDEPFPVLGRYLEKDLGKDFLSVGFLFHHGSFQAIDQNGYGLTELTVAPPPAGTLEDTFQRAGSPLSFLDLRRLPASGPVSDWFRRPQVMREIGSTWSSEADMATEVVLPELYEAVIYIEATTRARPNPPTEP